MASDMRVPQVISTCPGNTPTAASTENQNVTASPVGFLNFGFQSDKRKSIIVARALAPDSEQRADLILNQFIHVNCNAHMNCRAE